MKSFEELKQGSMSGEGLKFLAQVIRYNLGTHKKTRLKQAGVSASHSLLHDEVSARHAERLSKELQRRAKRIGKDTGERLRFLTILHSTENLSDHGVRAAVVKMEKAYKKALTKLRLWSRGAIELEIVNLTILRKLCRIKSDEARKLNVLENLIPLKKLQGQLIPKSSGDTRVLVHLHCVVDLGEDFDANEKKLRKLFDGCDAWQRSPYQIELKKTFKDRTTANNLRSIAAYVTKGGNENLRYNAGFGRDLAEDLDAKIWRAGLGRSDKGAETIEDERGLTIGEVRRLDELYCWLMNRRRDRRGYILAS